MEEKNPVICKTPFEPIIFPFFPLHNPRCMDFPRSGTSRLLATPFHRHHPRSIKCSVVAHSTFGMKFLAKVSVSPVFFLGGELRRYAVILFFLNGIVFPWKNMLSSTFCKNLLAESCFLIFSDVIWKYNWYSCLFLFAQPEKWNICASVTLFASLISPPPKKMGVRLSNKNSISSFWGEMSNLILSNQNLWSSTSSMFISSHLSHPTVNRGSRTSCSNPWVQVWHVKCSDKIIVNWWMFYPAYRSHVWCTSIELPFGWLWYMYIPITLDIGDMYTPDKRMAGS